MARPPRTNASSQRKAPLAGKSASNFLAPLRATKMVASRPSLPAELIAMILDFLPVPDLLHFARVSKRMLEMVYDDTRWIQKLNAMGCWKEAEARKRVEEGMRRKVEAQRARETEATRRTGVELSGSMNGIAGGGTTRRASVMLFDAGWEEQKQQRAVEQKSLEGHRNNLTNGFNAITLSPNGNDVTHSTSSEDHSLLLHVLKNTRSVRGSARQEYSRIYKALAPFYLDLARSRSHTDPIMFRVFREPEHQAQMLALLRIFARSDSSQGWQRREEKLESMISIFENAVLREFEQGCEADDVDGRMKRYAHVLVMLNGGAACVDSYIHNNRLMLDKDKLGKPLQCLEGQTPNTVNLKPSHAFFERLSSALNRESALIDRVFPVSVDVLIPFLDRIGEDIISEYITPLFDEAHSGNLESYLKLVAGVYEQSAQFIWSLRPAKGSVDGFAEKAAQIVNRSFEPHVDLYLQEELDFFKNKSTSEVETWERQLSEQEASAESFFMANVTRQAVKQDFLTSFRKVVMMPVNVIPTYSPFATKQPANSGANSISAEPESGRSTPLPPGETPISGTATSRQDAPTTELAAKAAIMNSKLEGIRSLFSIEVALNLVHTAKSSLERAAHFVRLGGQSGEEAKEQCEAIFIHLLQILGFLHIKPGFDKAVAHLSSYNAHDAAGKHPQPQLQSSSGVKPLVTFLELVNVGDLIQQMLDVFYVQELVAPHLTDRDDFLNPAVKEKRRFEQMLDERVAAGLNKGIDVLMSEVEFLCATTQPASDYNPTSASDAALFDIGPSPTARAVVDLVASHTGMLVGSTDKTMLDVFTQEVGVRLFASLCKHLKRQRVAAGNGAVKLICDMNHYYGYIAGLKNKELLRYFGALRELSQIFLIEGRKGDEAEIAKIVADGEMYKGVFGVEEVLEFAERRADWWVVRRDVEKAMYGIGCAVM